MREIGNVLPSRVTRISTGGPARSNAAPSACEIPARTQISNAKQAKLNNAMRLIERGWARAAPSLGFPIFCFIIAVLLLW
jgi:hypothetical protein